MQSSHTTFRMVIMPESPRIVVGVAGRIGSGKTAIAQHIERDFGFQYLRYSQILAEWFQADPADKVRLQKVGGVVMAGADQVELNRRLIDRIDPRSDVVVDGLRHPTDHASLHAAFEDDFFLVYVDTPATIRFERLGHRYRTFAEFCEADAHSVESQIDSLRSVATVVLPGTMDFERLMTSVHRLILDFRERKVA